MAKFYKTPPLTFQGNKKNMLKNFIHLLENMKLDGQITDKTVFYDVFGGSGLLANTVKHFFPQNRVIWNDFDDYQSRLDKIEITQKIKDEIYEKVMIEFNKKERLNNEEIAKIHEILDSHNEADIDFLNLSSNLLFGGNYVRKKEDFKKCLLYNNLSLKRLDKSGYLEGVERVKMDFVELLDSIPQELKEKGEAFLILDPPYLQTSDVGYSVRWKIRSFLTLIKRIFKPYILFSSESSDILEFIEFLKNNGGFETFREYKITKAKLNINSKDDFMIYSCNRVGLFESV